MRTCHLGQHHEVYNAADIEEFDVSAFFIDVEQAEDADLRVNKAREHRKYLTPQPALRDGNGLPWGADSVMSYRTMP